jgi:hypothetical protein
MKTNEIKEILMKSLYETSKGLFVTNFTGCGFAECDVLRITESNIVYEYEIKNSRSDFKADFKKVYKHDRLSGRKDRDQEYIKWNGNPGRPNHFYYVCREGLIQASEVPEYSGLIWIVGDKIEVKKKASKLHSFKANDKLVRAVAKLLSARFVFGGCSYMNYAREQREKLFHSQTESTL